METNFASPRTSAMPGRPEVRRGHSPAALLFKTAILCAAALLFCESTARWAGVRPHASDMLTFQRYWNIVRHSPSAVALIGSSRMLADVDPVVLHRAFPRRTFYLLGLNGESPMPLLEEFATDREFHGLVLCEFHPAQFMAKYPFFHKSRFQEYVTGTLRFGDRMESWLSEHLKEDLAALSAVREQTIAQALHLPGVPPDEPRDDRFLDLHRGGQDNRVLMARWIDRRREEQKWLAGPGQRVETLVPGWVQQIRARSGNVVFVEFPVSGSLGRMEAGMYEDRDKSLASLAASGIVVVGPAWDAPLAGYECPDESHLDGTQAASFTTALAGILKDRKVLE